MAMEEIAIIAIWMVELELELGFIVGVRSSS